ncbi:MAG: S-layer homology domain-containing protein, partial [Clostridia bacterium]|nr:S-layer homology domain-containing protein [Clostridia bacterium]
TPIRNLGTIGAAVTDETGKVIWSKALRNNLSAPFYDDDDQKWYGTDPVTYKVGADFSDLDLIEGDRITIGAYALPEYYTAEYLRQQGKEQQSGELGDEGFKAILESGTVGDGAAIKYTFTVDNTAPRIENVFRDLENGDILIKAGDNNYIAAEYVYSLDYTVLASGQPEQSEPSRVSELLLNMGGIMLPRAIIVAICDYAGNETYYEVELNQEVDLSGTFIGFVPDGRSTNAFSIDLDSLHFDKNGFGEGESVFASLNGTVTAAEYVDGYVFLAMNDGKLYVADILSLYDYTYVSDYSESASTIYDMAFDYGTNTMYALGEDNTVFSVDLITCALTPEFRIPTDAFVNGIAVDDEEHFFYTTAGRPSTAMICGFDLSDPESELFDGGSLLGMYNMNNGGGLAYDHSRGVLYFASNWSGEWDEDQFIVIIDTETGEISPVNDLFGEDSGRIGDSIRGMFIVPSDDRIINKTDVATAIENDGHDEYELLKGQVKELELYARPWTLKDRGLIYVSSDESVIEVTDNGVIKAVGIGEAFVTVSTAAEPHLEIRIHVTVDKAPHTNLTALIYDENGATAWCEFNTDHPEEWEAVNSTGRYNAAGLTGDTIYAVDDMSIYAIDAETFEVASLGSIVSDHLFTDAAPIPEGFVFHEAEPTLATVCGDGFCIGTIEPDSGYYHYEDVSVFIGDDPMATIAFVTGEIDLEGDGVGDPIYYVLTESGAIYEAVLLSNYDYTYLEYLGETGITLDIFESDQSRASLYYDEETEFLYLAKYIYPDETAYLYAIDANDFERNTETGSFGADVWPVIGLYTFEPGTELSISVRPTVLSVYPGSTTQLSIIVKHGETNGFTAVSSDPDVVSVDETGLVTALDVGEATITVTTDDVNSLGERLTKEVRVNVIETVSLDTSVVCQISDESGDHFAKLDLRDLSYEAVADAPGKVTAGARSGNVYFAGMNDNVQTLDAETFGETDWDCYSNYFATYVPQDVANYPTFSSEGETTDSKFLFTTEYGYLLDTDFYGWNLGSNFPDMAAIELIGYGEEIEDGEVYPYYEYLLLTTGGILYDLPVYYTVGSLNFGTILDTGLRLSDPSDVSMAYVLEFDDQEEVKYEGVIFAIESAKQVWYLDFLDGNKVKLVGNFEMEHVDGLVGYFDQIGTEEELVAAFSNGSTQARALEKPAKAKATAVAAEQFPFENAAGTAETGKAMPDPAPTGLRPAERASAHYMPVIRGATGNAADGEVALALTEDTDTTNGVIRVEYDPEAMEYVGASSEAALISVNAADGIITVAYASDEEITAGETIATLNFSYTDGYVDTEVTVYTEELGPDFGIEEEGETVTILKEDGDHELEEISRVEATCTEDGLITSKCSKCGGVFEEVIPALGHSIEDIAEVPATCTQPGTTAGKKCSVCGEVFEGLEVIFPTGHNAVIDEAVEPGCETVGYTVGTHCSNCGEVLIAQNEIPAKGHVWDEGVITTEPTYEAEGVKTFTCSVCGATRTEVVPKLDHRPLPCKDDESCPGKVFKDMPARGTWAHDPIDWAVEYGVTQGTSPTTFGPDELVSRAQVVTFLWRAAGSPEPAPSGVSFTDVKADAYYYKPVMWALEKGITKGATTTSFDPDGVCTRGQIVTFLYRYAGSPAVSGSTSKFNDVIKGAFYEAAVTWAVEENITSGVSATKFAPNDVCTRAQTVTFLYRFANK